MERASQEFDSREEMCSSVAHKKRDVRYYPLGSVLPSWNYCIHTEYAAVHNLKLQLIHHTEYAVLTPESSDCRVGKVRCRFSRLARLSADPLGTDVTAAKA